MFFKSAKKLVPLIIFSAYFLNCTQNQPPNNPNGDNRSVTVHGKILGNSISPLYSICAIVTGDNIQSPLTFPLSIDIQDTSYSGEIEIPRSGSNWAISVQLKNPLLSKTGQAAKNIDNVASLITIDIFNGNCLPVLIAGKDTTVSILDSIRLHAVATDTFNGQIVSWALFLPSYSNPISLSHPDTSFVIGKDTGNFAFIFRCMDNDSNFAFDTTIVRIIQGYPTLIAGNDTILPYGSQLSLRERHLTNSVKLLSGNGILGTAGNLPMQILAKFLLFYRILPQTSFVFLE